MSVIELVKYLHDGIKDGKWSELSEVHFQNGCIGVEEFETL